MASRKFDKKFGKEFVACLPAAPGVYRVFDDEGCLIYVGKAKNLRRRLAQYRNAKRCKRHKKMRAIVQKAARITWETCPTDLDACLQETRLIQELRPRLNVAAAFAFLYPMIGMRVLPEHTLFCLTTRPDLYPEFQLFGAFRSRYFTGEAFFSLMRLLPYVGHSVPHKRLVDLKRERSYVFAFRRLPAEWPRLWENFFRGSSADALEELVFKLLENAAARKRAEEIQEGVDSLRRFWKHEAMRLASAISFTGFADYPVPQNERDPLFLRYRTRTA
jgi:excinuclease UvrABC nuclease subunit